jgi:flavin reductase (DIM6/NTAB) family NADH-FMN oxidoreductase RutF
MGEAAHRSALTALGYGLYVATSTDGAGVRAGWAANWVMQCSFEPVLVALAARAGTTRASLIGAGRVFAVNIMEAGQQELVRRFYLPVEETGSELGGVPFRAGETGCPILEDALGFVECRVIETHTPGDHVLHVGEVVASGMNRDGRPLTMSDVPVDYDG